MDARFSDQKLQDFYTMVVNHMAEEARDKAKQGHLYVLHEKIEDALFRQGDKINMIQPGIIQSVSLIMESIDLLKSEVSAIKEKDLLQKRFLAGVIAALTAVWVVASEIVGKAASWLKH